jgi:hypothetical protein
MAGRPLRRARRNAARRNGHFEARGADIAALKLGVSQEDAAHIMNATSAVHDKLMDLFAVLQERGQSEPGMAALRKALRGFEHMEDVVGLGGPSSRR